MSLWKKISIGNFRFISKIKLYLSREPTVYWLNSKSGLRGRVKSRIFGAFAKVHASEKNQLARFVWKTNTAGKSDEWQWNGGKFRYRSNRSKNNENKTEKAGPHHIIMRCVLIVWSLNNLWHLIEMFHYEAKTFRAIVRYVQRVIVGKTSENRQTRFSKRIARLRLENFERISSETVDSSHSHNRRLYSSKVQRNRCLTMTYITRTCVCVMEINHCC